MSQKGPQFERDLSKQLSRWWSGSPEEDDLFWRTSQSGGRATTRGKKGKKTRNSYGDIKAEDPDAQKFTDLICLEAKKGYSKETIANLLDVMPRKPLPTYAKWIQKIQKTAKDAGVPYWMLITKRDGKDVVCYFDTELWHALYYCGACLGGLTFTLTSSKPEFTVTCMRLSEFFAKVSADNIRALWKKHQKKGASNE